MIDFEDFNKQMEKNISEYAARRAFLGLLVAASATGACYALNNPRNPEEIFPTETPITHPNPTEVFAPIEKIGPYEIAASGVGYADTLSLKEGDTDYENKIKAKALEAFEPTNPNLSISRIVVQNYQIKGEKGDAPFPIITVVDTLDPTKIVSAFAGFAIDKYGVLTPPYEGDDLGILVRLTYVDTPNGGIAIGAQDIQDPTSIYKPAFFNIDKNKNTTFSNPYTDDYSFNRSVPIEGTTQITSMVSYSNEEVAPTPSETSEFNIVNSTESEKISKVTLEDLKSGKLAKFEHSKVDKLGPINPDPSTIDYIYWTYDSAISLDSVKKNGSSFESVKVANFVSLYSIDLSELGYEGKQGFVASYIYEDSKGDTAIFHYILTEKQAKLAEAANLFTNPAGILTAHSVFESQNRDQFYIDGKPNSKDDLRSLNEKLYPIQGYTIKDINSLFKNISNTDTFSDEDTKIIETVLFHASMQTTNQ